MHIRRGGYNYVTNLSSVTDEYDDLSDEELGIQHFNDDDVGCYGYSNSGVSKFTTVLIDNMFPTSKTSIIGKEVGEFELLTSSSVWGKVLFIQLPEIIEIFGNAFWFWEFISLIICQENAISRSATFKHVLTIEHDLWMLLYFGGKLS